MISARPENNQGGVFVSKKGGISFELEIVLRYL